MKVEDKYIWVAGNGLVKYNKQTSERVLYTERDGLLDNATSELSRVGDELWALSNVGLWRVY